MNQPVKVEIAKILFDNHGVLFHSVADVVMWLYEHYTVWIEVYYDNSKKEFYTVLNGEEYKYNTPAEAYETAIEHILNNLKDEISQSKS